VTTTNSFVSLRGVTRDGQNHTVTIVLQIEDTRWTANEPGGSSNVFLTKSGVWMRAVNVVTLFKNDATTRVGQLKPLVPENASQGQTGEGSSFELAVDFDWVVL
jgi:hypothetical protein